MRVKKIVSIFASATMKKLFTLFLGLWFTAVTAQNFSGSLFMKDEPSFYLNQVYVTNIAAYKTVLASYNGEFKIQAKEGDLIRFTSIVTQRKDLVVTRGMLENTNNLIALEIAYREIPEILLSRFRASGNLPKDVRTLDSKKTALELAKIIGLPAPKGDGTPPVQPLASLANGGLSISLETLFDVISGENKKKQRLYEYERMSATIRKVRAYFGDDYFTKVKIPKELIDNFLQFVYTSENITLYVETANYESVKVPMEKYLPIYLKRLRNSNLQNLLKSD